MDAAEYKHVVLGLIFLKYIADDFEEEHTKLEADRAKGADPEDPDEYRALNIFWVPKEARWPDLRANAKLVRGDQILNARLLAPKPASSSRAGKVVDKSRRGHRSWQEHCGGIRVIEIVKPFLGGEYETQRIAPASSARPSCPNHSDDPQATP